MDLNVLPLARREGQDLPALPGLHITSQPRRPARNRQNDRLLLFFRQAGNLPLEQEQQDKLLERLAHGYYQTGGSVTAAMRTVAETLNQFLLDRNLRSSASGQQGYGRLMIVVLREGRVFLGQCGGMHAFRITPNQVEHFYDADLEHRDLGMGRATPVTYFYSDLAQDEALLICARPPAVWLAGGLSGAYGQGPESLRRRLVSQAGDELEAVLLVAKAGSGKVHLLSTRPGAAVEEAAPGTQAPAGESPAGAAPSGKPAEQEQAPRPGPDGGEAAPRPAPVPAPAPQREAPARVSIPPWESEDEQNTAQPAPAQARPASVYPQPAPAQPEQPAVPQPQPTAVPQAQPAPSQTAAAQPGPVQASAYAGTAAPAAEAAPAEQAGKRRWFGRRRQEAAPAQPTETAPPAAATMRAEASTAAETAEPAQRPARGPSPLLRGAAAIGGGLSRFSRGAARISGAILRRLLPGEGSLPSSMMAFFAVAIPVMVVAAAMYVYLKEGVTRQYLAAFEVASRAAETARAETAPDARRQAWLNVVAAVEQAEQYQVTEATRGLQVEAQSVFDQLDNVRRLDFQPAIAGGLPGGTRISRMVASSDALYMLDAESGNVLRAVRTTRGYELDSSFACGPSLPGALSVGALVDIALIPPDSDMDGDLLAMDGAGNLLQCEAGAQPLASMLAPPPTGWGTPLGFTLDGGNLYVVDPHPQKNAVWAYWGAEFTSQPQLFFSEEVPPMADVIDLAVDKRDLYLLHADGHLTLCTFSDLGVSPTRCADPVPYSDSRPGREGQPMQPEHAFTQIVTTRPPDPSIYLLEGQSQAIYHFSLRLLTFQKQFRPVTLRAEGGGLGFPKDPATAFALSPDSRVAFLALGDQVYYAGTP